MTVKARVKTWHAQSSISPSRWTEQLPPLNIKLGVMKNIVMAMDSDLFVNKNYTYTKLKFNSALDDLKRFDMP